MAPPVDPVASAADWVAEHGWPDDPDGPEATDQQIDDYLDQLAQAEGLDPDGEAWAADYVATYGWPDEPDEPPSRPGKDLCHRSPPLMVRVRHHAGRARPRERRPGRRRRATARAGPDGDDPEPAGGRLADLSSSRPGESRRAPGQDSESPKSRAVYADAPPAVEVVA
jgi:hypothetical protein